MSPLRYMAAPFSVGAKALFSSSCSPNISKGYSVPINTDLPDFTCGTSFRPGLKAELRALHGLADGIGAVGQTTPPLQR